MAMHLCLPRVGFVMAGPQDLALKAHVLRMIMFLLVCFCYLIPSSMVRDSSYAIRQARPNVRYDFVDHLYETSEESKSDVKNQRKIKTAATSSTADDQNTADDQTTTDDKETSTEKGRLLSTKESPTSSDLSQSDSTLVLGTSDELRQGWICYWWAPPSSQDSLLCTGGRWSEDHCQIVMKDAAKKANAKSACMQEVKSSLGYSRHRVVAAFHMVFIFLLAAWSLVSFAQTLAAYEKPEVDKLKIVLLTDIILTMTILGVGVSIVIFQNTLESSYYWSFGLAFWRNISSFILFGFALLCSCYLTICNDRLMRCANYEKRIQRVGGGVWDPDSPDAGALAQHAANVEDKLDRSQKKKEYGAGGLRLVEGPAISGFKSEVQGQKFEPRYSAVPPDATEMVGMPPVKDFPDDETFTGSAPFTESSSHRTVASARTVNSEPRDVKHVTSGRQSSSAESAPTKNIPSDAGRHGPDVDTDESETWDANWEVSRQPTEEDRLAVATVKSSGSSSSGSSSSSSSS